MSCHGDGKHGNCVTAKMSKKINVFFLFFFFCWKSSSSFSTSQHLGRIVWVAVFFFFTFISTIYLSLYSMREITAQVKRKI